MQLNSNTEMTRELATGGESHDYEIAMEAGQLVQVVAHQLGIDVAVALYDPDSDLVLEVDSPTGRQGPERLLAVTETAGTYHVVVRAIEHGAPAGSYRLEVKELRPASPEDRRRAAAAQTFSQAEASFLEGTQDAREAAVKPYQEARAVWRALGDREREADALLRLGWVHRDLRRHADATAFLEDAREIYRTLGEDLGRGMALDSLGGVWIKLGENREALPLVERTLNPG